MFNVKAENLDITKLTNPSHVEKRPIRGLHLADDVSGAVLLNPFRVF